MPPLPRLPSSKDAFVNGLNVHQGRLRRHARHGRPQDPAACRPSCCGTTGRKSGVTRANALVYGKDGERLMVEASNGGSRKPPAWLLNLEADAEVEAQVGVRRWPVTAVDLSPDDPEYERLFANCNKANRVSSRRTGR
jgi:deazaflavin-dependent oxidoreductase (nitroreductase family)